MIITYVLLHMYYYICIITYTYIYIYILLLLLLLLLLLYESGTYVVAIFYPFSQFCEILFSLMSLRKQPNLAPNLFQRGVEYGKYVKGNLR